MRKVISVILAVIMSACLFVGCSLFEYDNEKDFKQVAVKIDSVKIDGGDGKSFTTDVKYIYKYDVVSYFNQVGPTLVQQNGYTAEQALTYCVDQLIVRELILNEYDAQESFGNVKLSNYETNQINKNFYAYIDSQLMTIRNEILSEQGKPTTDQNAAEGESDSTSTTYPVKEEVVEGTYDGWTVDALRSDVITRLSMTEDVVNTFSQEKLISLLEQADLSAEELWTPDEARYPGLYGDDETKSIELESMRRLMAEIKKGIQDDYRLTEKERKEYLADVTKLNAIGDGKGVPYIYPALMNANVMSYYVKDNYVDNAKMQLLQQYVTMNVDVTSEEIEAQYNATLAEQQQKYNTTNAFATDVTGDNAKNIVYYPDGSYFFVKHILVPFSDAQTAELDAYKKGEGTLAGADAIAAKKEEIGRAVMGYEHRDGEDYGAPIAIQDIYADIQRELVKYDGDLRQKAAAFDDLIYKYNTDTGIFNNDLGYAVMVTTGDEYDTKYMEEFSKAAKELYEGGVEGALSQPVATDYGVHILYLQKIIPAQGMTVGLNDYLSYSSSKTVYDSLRESKLSSKTSQVFNVWQNEKIGNYQTVKKVITRYEDVYKDLIEEE